MLVYTFRTFPLVAELEEMFGNVFVFSKLKQDFATFERLLAAEPDYVLGVALNRQGTRAEPIAVNQFNKGKVLTSGPDTLQLTLPSTKSDIPAASRPTKTFCNWTMYRVQNSILEQQLATKFTFIHVRPNDLGLLRTVSR